MKPYVLDDASTLEYQRLDLMSKILDPWTRGYLTALGVGEGWQCLELGSGNGSIAEWLSETVGPSGNVTAIDINPVLLELIPEQNLSVRQMDVRTSSGELPANAYDLVSCRALLLPDLRVRSNGARADGRCPQPGWMAGGARA